MSNISKRAAALASLLLQDRGPWSVQELALKLGVSTKTVRNNMKELNAYVASAGQEISFVKGVGYQIGETTAKELQKLLKEDTEAQLGQVIVPTDPEERREYIVTRLLTNELEHEEVIDFYDFAEELFVSTSTLKNDIMLLQKKMKDYNLRIGMTQKRGIFIKGAEEDLRSCISEHIFSTLNEHKVAIDDLRFFKTLFSAERVEQLQEILNDIISMHQFRLTDTAFKNLLVHILIMLKRSKLSQNVVYDPQVMEAFESSREYEIAKKIAEQVKKKMHLDLEGELHYLTQTLMTARTLGTQEKEEIRFADTIQKISAAIQNMTGIDLSEDKYLKQGLENHLKVSLNRIRFRMKIRNTFLDSMKNSYPLAFELAVIASSIIEKDYGMKPDENEIGLLAIHLGAALERQGLMKKQTVKNVLIVCASGMATAMLLAEKVKREFSGQVKIVDILPLYEIDEGTVEDVDLILTTVPIENIHSDRIVQVSIAMEKPEIERIRTILDQQEEEGMFENIFKADLFFTDQELKSKKDVLTFMTNAMIQSGYMNEEEKDSVFRREEMASTELGAMVAIPHVLFTNSEEPVVSVCTLANPILWDEEKVQVVLLLNIPKSAYRIWEVVFKTVYHCLITDYGVYDLIKNGDYEEFIFELYQEYKKNKE